MQRNIYKNIKDFGNTPENKNLESNNPLSYCLNWTLDQQFLHGGNSYIYGQYSKPCQAYLSDYCAEGWDGFCETASKNVNISFPNQLELKRNLTSGIPSGGSAVGMTAGDILVRNTAAKKYLVSMEGNCVQKFQPFDPTVASSPMISYWESEFGADHACVPYYAVNPADIDNDPVMNKLLEKPSIAFDILVNIYRTMKSNGTLSSLSNTKIGKYFDIYFAEKKESFQPTPYGPTIRPASIPTYMPSTTPPINSTCYCKQQPYIQPTPKIPYEYSY